MARTRIVQARRLTAEARRAESNAVALLREELDKVKADDQREREVAEEVAQASRHRCHWLYIQHTSTDVFQLWPIGHLQCPTL